MTSIQRIVPIEDAKAEIIRIAELSDAVLSCQPKFDIPKDLPQPDFIMAMPGKGHVVYYIVETRTDCVQACLSFEQIKRIYTDPEEVQLELYCRDLAVKQWLKHSVSSSSDEIR